MKYTKPYIADFGKAATAIQGNCGVGIEMPGFDKTDGKVYYNIMKYYCEQMGVVQRCYCYYPDGGICATEPYYDSRCY